MGALSSSPVNIRRQFCGPEEIVKTAKTKPSRDHYVLAFNETVSLTDEVAYQANVAALTKAVQNNSKDLANRVCSIDRIKTDLRAKPHFQKKTELEITQEAVKRYLDIPKNLEGKHGRTAVDVVIAIDDQDLQSWTNPVTVVEKYSDLCEEHLKRRVDNFILQLITAFNTQLHYEIGPTQDQGESAKALYVEYKGKLYFVCKRNAAHSSTFPCLIAYDKNEWKAYVEGTAPKPRGIYYLQKSDIYKSANSTMNLPDSINKADIDVDGVHHDSEFNEKALELVNNVSDGMTTLKQAVIEFLDSLKTITEEEEETEQRLDVKKALAIYLQKINTIQADFLQNPDGWIFSQMNLLVDQAKTTNELSAVMLQIRASAIKRNMRAQSNIMHKVDALGKSLLREVMGGRKKAPPNFKSAFHSVILDNMRTIENRQKLSKLFALNFPTIGRQKTQIENTKKLIEAANKKTQVNRIQSLAIEIGNDMRSMLSDEMNHRGDSMRKLRNGKRWSQTKLGDELRKRYPQEFSSQPTISRTERGERYMSRTLAKELSETFEVPLELLLPQFFYV